MIKFVEKNKRIENLHEYELQLCQDAKTKTDFKG